ncbi:uncharacterized protein TNCV_2396281 [Trichonephila clavipes]|uniref:Uncharacterized protein n=1 Tax=Trichonephila clavipes TaxID=2585209 RepID=A0A8X6VR49_TRICX|nr:uncharacterized protein TNCV_2396281 [Trichonephila clavipes]
MEGSGADNECSYRNVYVQEQGIEELESLDPVSIRRSYLLTPEDRAHSKGGVRSYDQKSSGRPNSCAAWIPQRHLWTETPFLSFEDLSTRISVAAERIRDMPGIFQNVNNSMQHHCYASQTTSGMQANADKSYFHPSVLYTVSILSDDQRTDQDTFVDTFVQLVYESDTLKDLFDLSETPAIGYSHHAYNDSVIVLTSLGATNPDKIADFETRPMAQNFKVFTREEMVTVYSNKASSYAYSQGILTQNNAKYLAVQYANIYEKTAKEYVVEGDPTSKYQAIGNGFIQFVMSIDDNLTVEKGWVLAIFYESYWLMLAAETPASRVLFENCSAEADHDSN